MQGVFADHRFSSLLRVHWFVCGDGMLAVLRSQLPSILDPRSSLPMLLLDIDGLFMFHILQERVWSTDANGPSQNA
jgi:hypothetical protein